LGIAVTFQTVGGAGSAPADSNPFPLQLTHPQKPAIASLDHQLISRKSRLTEPRNKKKLERVSKQSVS
jgi:hypothetical protein